MIRAIAAGWQPSLHVIHLDANHRNRAVKYLVGRGVEIGALARASPVRPTAQVNYVDCVPLWKLARNYEEIPLKELLRPSILCDLDWDCLLESLGGPIDFVIALNVIDHSANPIRVIENIFKAVKSGGTVAIAIKSAGALSKGSSLESLWKIYRGGAKGITTLQAARYLRRIGQTRKKMGRLPFALAIRRTISRREAVHSWTSEECQALLKSVFKVLLIQAEVIYESLPQENGKEYFGVYRLNETV